MGDSPEEIKKHVRVYIAVFIALAILTVVTVAASYLQLNQTWTIILALIIATFKASLVAGYFMHLLNEEKTIYWILALTLIFFITVMVLPAGQHKGHLTGMEYTEVKDHHHDKEHH